VPRGLNAHSQLKTDLYDDFSNPDAISGYASTSRECNILPYFKRSKTFLAAKRETDLRDATVGEIIYLWIVTALFWSIWLLGLWKVAEIAWRLFH
jgi:hypothetical protein